MTKEEAYELMQKQNWYKLFIKAMESKGKIFNDSYRLHYAKDWIEYAFAWHYTPQGREYWSNINSEWRTLVR
jgi:hypothetical protein